MHARIQIYWCTSSIFRHLKLELLTQFPAPNDEKYINVVYIWRKFVSFYGYVHWRMTTEISVMYGSEKVNLLKVHLENTWSWTNVDLMLPQRWNSTGPVSTIRGNVMLVRRLHATKWVNILWGTSYLVLVNKILLVLYSPDRKLYMKRLYSYFHSIHLSSLNCVYIPFGFARSWGLQLLNFMPTNRFTVTKYV